MQIPLSATLTSPFSRETEESRANAVRPYGDDAETFCAANAMKITKATLKTNTQNTNAASTGKGNYGVCKPKADSEGNERFRRTVSQRFP